MANIGWGLMGRSLSAAGGPLLVMTLFGCVSTHAARLSPLDVLPAISRDSVRVFGDSAQVPSPFVVIGYLSLKSSLVFSRARLESSLKSEAALLGANGVILDRRVFAAGLVVLDKIPAIRYDASGDPPAVRSAP